MSTHHVRLTGLPAWVSAKALLGEGAWVQEADHWQAQLTAHQAADLAARLRGVGLGGAPLQLQVQPKLSRPLVRAARTEEARRRRETSPGFTHPGMRLDQEGRWSLTPERIADQLAKWALSGLPEPAHVVDAGCGCGGNTLAFARAGARVTAFDVDAHRAELCAHNVRVAGLTQQVQLSQGAWEPTLAGLSGDLLFLDPPWGLDWNRDRTTVADLPGLEAALSASAGRFRRTAIKLPPSFDPSSLPGARPRAFFGVAAGDKQRVKLVAVLLGD